MGMKKYVLLQIIFKKMNWVRVLLLFAVAVALIGCGRIRQKTFHHVETDEYTLAVSGQRLLTDGQVAAVPRDTARWFGDTVRLNDDVTSVALRLEELSHGTYSFSERYHGKGNYVLRLELIHHAGSEHEANCSAALAKLRDWGYINIDTIRWHHLAVVRQGTALADYGEKKSYGTKPYDIYLPKELMADSVGETTLGEWLDGWMESILSTDNELFSFLASHGYDTVQTSPQSVQVYPSAARRYKPIWLLGL